MFSLINMFIGKSTDIKELINIKQIFLKKVQMYVMIGRYREKLGNIDHIASILIVKLNMLSLVACE